jgi:hypothetical protein
MTAKFGDLSIKTFKFGKIDFNGSGRKNCAVEVTVELNTSKNGKPEFTASGEIWNPRHTYCYCAGQCLDTIAKYVKNPEFKQIYTYWKKYHLNSMHAGTIEQEDALEQWHESLQGPNKIVLFDYKRDCEYLKSIGLYEVEYEGQPYTYGTKWLYKEIPTDDLKGIESLLAE